MSSLPKRSSQDEGEKPSHAHRAAPAAWRPVRRRLPRPLGRANPAFPGGARVPHRGGSGTLLRRLGSGTAGGPVAPAPASPSRRSPSPPASLPPGGCRAPRRRRRPEGGPPAHRGPRSTTSPLAEKKLSPATPPAGPVGAPSPAPAARPFTAAAAPGAATAPAAPKTPGPTGRCPAVPVRPPVPPGMRLPCEANGREWRK